MKHTQNNHSIGYSSSSGAYLDHSTYYPWSAMMSLSALLRPYATQAQPTNISRGKRQYHFQVNKTAMLYLITDGVFHEKIKGSERVINTWFAPAIVGWSEPEQQDNPYYLERQGAGSLLVLPVAQAYEVTSQNNAMLDVIRVMSYYLKQREQTSAAIQDSAYNIVKSMIEQFVQLPVWYQQQTSLIQFIDLRTQLCKSSIMRILKLLRDAGFIAMKNGRLITTQQLPDVMP